MPIIVARRMTCGRSLEGERAACHRGSGNIQRNRRSANRGEGERRFLRRDLQTKDPQQRPPYGFNVSRPATREVGPEYVISEVSRAPIPGINRVSGKRIFDEADAWTQGSTCEMGKQGGGRERSKPKSRSAAERDALPLHREESGSGSDESDEGGDADTAGVAAAGDGRKGVYKNRSHSPSLVAPSSRLPPLPPSSPPAIEVSRAYPLQRISSLQ